MWPHSRWDFCATWIHLDRNLRRRQLLFLASLVLASLLGKHCTGSREAEKMPNPKKRAEKQEAASVGISSTSLNLLLTRTIVQEERRRLRTEGCSGRCRVEQRIKRSVQSRKRCREEGRTTSKKGRESSSGGRGECIPTFETSSKGEGSRQGSCEKDK